ncbi:carbohydrate ABC transporter membrane protein 1 (CUT1 family) [Mycoplasma testudineum]|uniref:Carbohydrate ABC transporter membrane protein 1 (CUT1 family) n=1 Tax=Mycoplasma testudineum TaxID=244584 RepID=A0A4R6IJL4_9MOLU|nr:ABC transporter permease subunit [Mycoplasma testudineum]OYD26436.1 hypothetical protein CG473_03965 [Mycoplasma testudineum]TDO22125.1 carbohydrate ABC transporter membrane protein 1 (CUT1 family) [Mycoplasma testudineum]
MINVKLNYNNDPEVLKKIGQTNKKAILRQLRTKYKLLKISFQRKLLEQKFTIFKNSKSLKLELDDLSKKYRKEKNLLLLESQKILESQKSDHLTLNGKNLKLELFNAKLNLAYYKSIKNLKLVNETQNAISLLNLKLKELSNSYKNSNSIKLINQETDKKIHELKNSYFESGRKRDTLKSKYKNQYLKDKDNYKTLKTESKLFRKNLAKEYKSNKQISIKNSKSAFKYLRSENIDLNSYGEAVNKYKESNLYYSEHHKYLYKVEEKFTPSFENKKYISLIIKEQLKLKKIVSINNYEAVSEYIYIVNKIEAYEKIIKTIEYHSNQINDLKSQIEKLAKSDEYKKSLSIKLRNINDHFSKLINDLKNRAHTLTKEAYKNKLSELKFKRKIEIKDAKLSDPYLSKKSELRFRQIKCKEEVSKILTVMYSTVDDERKKIPTKAFKYQRFISAILSFIFPGVGQILNKEYFKAVFFIVGAIFIYALALPLLFGVYHSQDGEGIFGLFNLSPIRFEDEFFGVVYADARYRLIEAIISLIVFSFALVIWISAIHDGYRTGFYREFGYRPKNVRDMKKFLSGTGLPLLISLPALVAISFIVVLPLVTTFLIGFTNYSSQNQPPGNQLSWIGFENFIEVFNGNYSRSFGYVSLWTVIWTFSVTVITIIIGTLIALVVDNPRIQGKKIWSMIFILPWAVPAFATILFFSAAFLGDGAGGSTLYKQFFSSSLDITSNTNIMRLVLVAIQVWLGSSYVFMLVSGIKKGIPDDLYEASAIDGSNATKTFMKITAPLIMQQVAPLLVGQFIFNFNNFGIIYLFSSGGPNGPAGLPGNPGSTDIMISLIFKLTTNSSNQIGLASAFTMVMSVFIVSASLILFLRSKAFRKEGV